MYTKNKMCGIFGYAGESPLEDFKHNGFSILNHRGPDAQGWHEEKHFGLGHCRLAINDLSPDGNQPFKCENSAVFLVANGEVYNAPALKLELQSHGAKFVSQSDNEVILHAYLKWGVENALARLNGMFAFAIFDDNTQELILARDKVGIKPLYYMDTPDCIHFASEIQLLMQAGKELDKESIDEYLCLGYLPQNKTPAKSISKLPPGHMLRKKATEQSKIHKYWQYQYGKKRTPLDEHSLKAAVNNAVKQQMQSDRPLGCLLSGGIDSSLVCANAAQHNPNLKTFIVRFEQSSHDESPYAVEIAKHLNLSYTIIDCKMPSHPDEIFKILDCYGEPFADPSAIPTYILCRETKKHVTVALSGDGGDEQVIGYSRYRHAKWINYLRCFPCKNQIGKALNFFFKSQSKLHKIGTALKTTELQNLFLMSSGIFHPLHFRHLTNRSFPLSVPGWDYIPKNSTSISESWAALDFSTYLPDDILTKVDRASMAHALEVRVPLLDDMVINVLHKIRYKDKVSTHKAPLTRLLSEYVPQSLWNRPKMGFQVPLDHWLKHSLRDATYDMLLRQTFIDTFGFNKSTINRLLTDHQNGIRDNQYFIWALLSLSRWHMKNEP